MKQIVQISLLVCAIVFAIQSTASLPQNGLLTDKVFNYQGSMPIKDDRAEPLTVANETVTQTPEELANAEAACWKLINDQSATTFATQNKVLDDLDADMQKYKLEDGFRAALIKITTKMRESMKDALDSLTRDAADEYFDALFETSENIIYLSTLLRDPKLDEGIFISLVKAVSRLSRNNSALIQQFTDMCSFMHRSPRPRALIF